MSFVGNSQFQRQRDYDDSIRSCIGYVVHSGSRSGTPYQAECGVLSVVYFCQGPAKPPQNKRKWLHTFVFINRATGASACLLYIVKKISLISLSLFSLLLYTLSYGQNNTKNNQYNFLYGKYDGLTTWGWAYGIINGSGEIITPAKYYEPHRRIELANGYTAIEGESKIFILNTEGVRITPTYWYHGMFGDFFSVSTDTHGLNLALLNMDGTLVLIPDCTYYDIVIDESGLAIVVRRGKKGVINKKGEFIIDCIYDNIGIGDEDYYEDGLIRVEQGEKVGLVNDKGKIILDCTYDKIHDFDEDGYALIEKNEKYGVVSKDALVFPCVSEDDEIYAGCGLVRKEQKGKMGLVNSSGENVVPYVYDDIHDFDNGFAVVEKGEKYGVINCAGKVIAPCEFSRAGIVDGLILIEQDGKFAIINSDGVATPFIFDIIDNSDYYWAIKSIWHRGEGHIGVRINGKWGFIDRESSTFVVPCEYEEVSNYCEGFAVVKKDGRYGVVNTDGELITPCVFDKIFDYKNGFALAVREGKRGVLDSTGQLCIPCRFDRLCDWGSLLSNGCIYNGLAKVMQNGKYGLINLNGKQTSVSFDEIGSYYGFAKVEKNGKYGLVNTDCELIVPCKYDDVYRTEAGPWIVTLGNKKGALDSEGNELIPCIFEDLKLYHNELMHSTDGEWETLSADGKTMVVVNGTSDYN